MHANSKRGACIAGPATDVIRRRVTTIRVTLMAKRVKNVRIRLQQCGVVSPVEQHRKLVLRKSAIPEHTTADKRATYHFAIGGTAIVATNVSVVNPSSTHFGQAVKHVEHGKQACFADDIRVRGFSLQCIAISNTHRQPNARISQGLTTKMSSSVVLAL